MRLHSIKLSGFKSFVEPTHFQLPGQLVGVVGPNGCGKSNIIDAVRWVLGESKASELRGESMQDVIFNGTTLRKPEELRLFLEEAAGVSKYKERRRETETRLKDTRENLTRVDDILRELTGNLEKLESQAEVAGRYRAMQQDAQLKLHQLWFLRHRDAAREEERVSQAVVAAVAALESKSADLRRAEAELEAIRQSHYEANDALHAAQGALAQAALEVSRFEERIRYVAAGRERLLRQRADLETQSASWRAREHDAVAE